MDAGSFEIWLRAIADLSELQRNVPSKPWRYPKRRIPGNSKIRNLCRQNRLLLLEWRDGCGAAKD